jgi:hypothetical protein
LTLACFNAATFAERREPIAMEAASSLAETTRLPDDSFASEELACMSEDFRLRCATLAA